MARTGAHQRPDRSEIVKRLNRLAGQVGGVARMLEEERYCIDILTQIQAIKSALSKAEDMILADHTEQRKNIDELVELFAAAKISSELTNEGSL